MREKDPFKIKEILLEHQDLVSAQFRWWVIGCKKLHIFYQKIYKPKTLSVFMIKFLEKKPMN